MQNHFKQSAYFIFTVLLLLQGCSLSCHSVKPSALGKASSSAAMEQLIDQPGPIELQTINSADWSVPLAGLLNLNNPKAIAAELKDQAEPIQIYAHLLKHPLQGDYLIDTGISQKLRDNPENVGISWLIRHVMEIDKIHLNKSTTEILKGLNGQLSGVFFTHLHLDHISGMPDIPDQTPLYIGQTESTAPNLHNLFVQGTTNQLLDHKQPLQEWQFQPDPQHHFTGIIDIFGDGSAFAISVPGHTSGSTAYLLRTTHGPVLITGDTCHTRWGWEHTVEPGEFTEDQESNLLNLQRLKNLTINHPQIIVRLGHQP